ncbi:MAG: hypothetical protein R2744_09530 [Bacteroidales bacterium]
MRGDGIGGELEDDFYEYDENYCVRGRHSGREFTLGDSVMVKVVKADLQKKQLDYMFADEEPTTGGGRLATGGGNQDKRHTPPSNLRKASDGNARLRSAGKEKDKSKGYRKPQGGRKR